jgi:hypothetical protein
LSGIANVFQRFRDLYVATVVVILFLLHPSITQQTFQMFRSVIPFLFSRGPSQSCRGCLAQLVLAVLAWGVLQNLHHASLLCKQHFGRSV